MIKYVDKIRQDESDKYGIRRSISEQLSQQASKLASKQVSK